MTLKSTTVLLLTCLLALIFLGNRNGRATVEKKGNTGAPGDETNFNGTPKTCVNCHNAGPATATMGIHLLTLSGDTVTAYQPNTDYIIRVDIDGVGSAIQGYGFQLIPLQDSTNIDVKGMSDAGGMSANNYKIASIPNGRTYAEQSGTSATDTFNVRWKSPVAGTGTLKLYASGDAVNGNNGTSGDGAAVATLTLPEAAPSTTAAPALPVADMKVWPNPAPALAYLQVAVQVAGDYRVRIYDAQGQLWTEQPQRWAMGPQTIPVSLDGLPSGLVTVQVTDGQSVASVKVLKI